jgi:hypothetical protein
MFRLTSALAKGALITTVAVLGPWPQAPPWRSLMWHAIARANAGT